MVNFPTLSTVTSAACNAGKFVTQPANFAWTGAALMGASVLKNNVWDTYSQAQAARKECLEQAHAALTSTSRKQLGATNHWFFPNEVKEKDKNLTEIERLQYCQEALTKFAGTDKQFTTIKGLVDGAVEDQLGKVKEDQTRETPNKAKLATEWISTISTKFGEALAPTPSRFSNWTSWVASKTPEVVTNNRMVNGAKTAASWLSSCNCDLTKVAAIAGLTLWAAPQLLNLVPTSALKVVRLA